MNTHHKNTRKKTWAAFAVAAMLLSACGGSDDDTPAPPPATTVGSFLDSAVEGLNYSVASGTPAATTADGHFSCQAGQTLSFSAGGLALGSAPCAATITPLTLAGLSTTSSAGKTLDFSAPAATFNAALNTTLAALPAPYNTRVVDDTRRMLAREHFENTLGSALGTPVAEASTQTHTLGSVGVSITRYQLQADKSFNVPYEGSNAAIKADFADGFLPAYGSGLAFKGKAADGTLEFYAITDRGPNGDGPNAPVPGAAAGTLNISKVFPAPSFAPSFGLVSVGKTGAVLKSSTPLKLSADKKITGLPPQSGLGSTGETPLTDAYVFDASKSNYDPNGLDPETLVLDTARNVLWTSDEYGPFIAKIDIATGIIQKKYGPGPGAADLPAVMALRRVNRGMEGLTLDVASGKLHGFLQSPIDPKDGAGKSLKAKPPGGTNTDVRHIAKFTRWLEFDPATETSKLYAYPIDGSLYDKDRTGNAKLGDVVSLGNGKFIVIEQGARKGDAKVFNKLMLVEILVDATNIAAMDQNLEVSSITQAASNGVDYSTVVTLKKTELLDLNAAGWLAEKAEGLTLVDDHTLALVNDDDFGLRTILFDANGATVAGSIEDCTVDAAGAIVSGCPVGVVGARLTRGSDTERPTRLWLIKFDTKFADFSLPA
jgi:hypothetical protein